MRIDELPEEYRPLSMWQYFLYQILFIKRKDVVHGTQK